jgi:anti-sigma regulatory factor (Ser/Thr protein kinase)
MKELTFEANVESLDEVMDFINEELERNDCQPEVLVNINLAVDEIFVNIANYAYPPMSGTAVVGIDVVSIDAGEEAVIKFEDTGKAYNPLEQPDPDLNKPPMEREIGGLGVFLVKKVMDKIEYSRIGNKNVLVMTKKIK